MKRWIGLMVLFLLFFGCISPSYNRYPSCMRDKAIDKGECVLYNPNNNTYPSIDSFCPGCKVRYCAYALRDSNGQAVYYETFPGGKKQLLDCSKQTIAQQNDAANPCNNIGFCFASNPTTHQNVSFPIASERKPYPCQQPYCKSMFCGNLKFQPGPPFLPELGYSFTSQPMPKSLYTQNLYRATCNFYLLNHNTLQKVNRATHVWQNTFRIGFGSNLSNFEEAKYYFPLSDRFVHLLSSQYGKLNLKDRYVNYLCQEKHYKYYVHAYLYKISGTARAEYYVNTNWWIDKKHKKDQYTTDWFFSGATLGLYHVWVCSPWSYIYGLTVSKFGHHGYFCGLVRFPSWALAHTITCAASAPPNKDCAGAGIPYLWKLYPYQKLYGSWPWGGIAVVPNKNAWWCGWPTVNYPANHWGTPSPLISPIYHDIYSDMLDIRTLTCDIPNIDTYCYVLQPGASPPPQWVAAGYTQCPNNKPPTPSSAVSEIKLPPLDSVPKPNTYGLAPGSVTVTLLAAIAEPRYGWAGCGKEPPAGTKVIGVKYKLYDPNNLKDPSVCATYPPPPLDFYKYNGHSWVPIPGNYIFGTYYDIKDSINGIKRTIVLTNVSFYDEKLYSVSWPLLLKQPFKTLPWECNTSMDCYSGVCDYDPDFGHARDFCVSKAGNRLNCLCKEVGLRTQPNNRVLCKPYADTPTFDHLKATVISNVSGVVTKTTVPAPDIFFLPNNNGQPINLNGSIGMAVADQFPISMVARVCGLTYNHYDLSSGFYTITYPSSPTGSTQSSLTPVPVYTPKLPLPWRKYACLQYDKNGICVKWYANVYLITSLGNCQADDGSTKGLVETSFPKLIKGYGWCSATTYATFAYINLDNIYTLFSTNNHNVIPVQSTVPSGGNGAGPIFGYMEIQGRALKQYISDVEAVRNRVDHLLKNNVMPIVWYVNSPPMLQVSSDGEYKIADDCRNKLDITTLDDDLRSFLLGYNFYYAPDQTPFFTEAVGDCTKDSNKVSSRGTCTIVIGSPLHKHQLNLGWRKKKAYDYYCSWKASYPFLLRTIGDSASIVIITEGTSPDNQRLMQLSSQCPRCLFAHYGTYAQINAIPVGALTRYDLVVWPFYVNAGSYSASDTSYYEDILLNIESRARHILSLRGKPSLVFLYIPHPTLTWSDEDSYYLLRYLLLHKRELIQAGVIGFYLPTWSPTPAHTYYLVPQPVLSHKDGHFCAIERAVDRYEVPVIAKTIYIRVSAESNFVNDAGATIPAPECQPCPQAFVGTSLCSKTCLTEDVNGNPVKCVLNPNYPADRQYCPSVAVNSKQDRCMDCNWALNNGYEIECTKIYADGSNTTFTLGKGTNLELYPEVVAALPKGQHCCLFTNDGNYTYTAISYRYLQPARIVFPKDGNPLVSCGLPPTQRKFCSVNLPEKNYVLKCKWK